MNSVTLSIAPDGQVRLVYCDDLRDLLLQGETTISRASHVEPAGTEWTADLSPVGGPVLGPFPTREQALSEEVGWLVRRHL